MKRFTLMAFIFCHSHACLIEATMGAACSSVETRAAEAKNHEIEKDLMFYKREERRTTKLLLLGTGECGKSTILKQIKTIHAEGFSEAELLQQRANIWYCIIDAASSLCLAMLQLKMPFDLIDLDHKAREVIEYADSVCRDMQCIPPSIHHAIMTLWEDGGVRRAFHERHRFQLIDTADYFFDNLARICSTHYVPTTKDILMCRTMTTGIVEVRFHIKHAEFVVIDVGGQRSERRKWIHCFDKVTALIYIVATSEYNQTIREDEHTVYNREESISNFFAQNRMVESMNLFKNVVNAPWFKNASIILFMNKIDLLEKKLKTWPLRNYFADYQGYPDANSCLSYMETRFEALNMNPNKPLYIHRTCATDTEQVQFVIDATIDTIKSNNMYGCGLINN